MRDRQQEVIVKEEEAKKRVARDLKEKRRLIKRREVRQNAVQGFGGVIKGRVKVVIRSPFVSFFCVFFF